VGEPVVAVTGRSRLALALAVALAALSLSAGTSAAGGGDKAVHKPPYKKGPTGGDQFNYVQTDPKTGEVNVLRIFPGIPPVVGCAPEPSAGWAMLTVPHHVTSPIEKVTVNFNAQLDPYSWVTAGVRDAHGEWLGVRKLQGPLAGDDKLVVTLNDHPAPNSEIVVEFGVQLGDACPQIGGASATFPSIVIE
jgi:hypothetical protein